jgi:hypothetical protein
MFSFDTSKKQTYFKERQSRLIITNMSNDNKIITLQYPVETSFTLRSKESKSFLLPRDGIRDLKVISEDDATVVMKIPCTNVSCSSSDSEASCRIDLGTKYKSNITIRTSENEVETFRYQLLRSCFSGSESVCLSPCVKYGGEYCDPNSISYKESDYGKVESSLFTVDIPYTSNTRYELLYH